MSIDTKYLSPAQVAEKLNVDVSTIYRYINRETQPLPTYKITEKTIRIDPEKLNNWLKTQGTI